MTEDADYEDILSGTVDEAESRIKELENPDYAKLLKMEKEGDDRKTLKEYLEKKVEETADVEEEDEVEEHVEEKSPVLSGIGAGPALAGGLIVGLIVGLAAASFVPMQGTQGDLQASPSQVQQDVKDLVTSGGFNGTATVSEPQVESGMYLVNITMEQETVNGTQTQSQQAYVSSDGKLLFPVRTLMGRTVSPVSLEAQEETP